MDDLSMEDVDNFDVAHAVEHATSPNNVPDREVVIEADDQDNDSAIGIVSACLQYLP
ncbi:hypothetical protein CKAH01_15171 [Colletotrichum kahawae]|uniref:Uncharacterized protein n=1 Tax=Colletotrichum kahawae TaxID=34407 RepID=A0AAD9YKQ9_COLKA|nr:hypothetical protein CKAH01_15171 [Colletotrichum kahawae]